MSNFSTEDSQFNLTSNKNNKYLINIKEDNHNLIILAENKNNIPNEIFEYNSEKTKLPGIFNLYSIKDIIIKLLTEKNKLTLIEENQCLKLVYTGLVESENAIFELTKRIKTLEEKINALYDLVKYQTEKLDTIFGFKSLIVTNNHQKDKILEWLNENSNGGIIHLKLVYRRGDNMDLSYFHNKCDNIGPNLVICESVGNEIFGGFNPLSYEGKAEKHDKRAFIFSLSKNKKYINKSGSKSSYIAPDHGPDFHWDFTFNLGNMKFCRSLIPKDQPKHNINTGESCYLDDEPLFGDGYSNCEVKEVEVFQVMKYIPVPFDK